MGIHTAIRTILSGYAGLTALVSGNIYWLQAPEGTVFPYVTYGLVSQTPVHAMGADAGLEGPRFQVDAWSESAAGMEDVSAQIKAALQDYSDTSAGVVIQRIFWENEIELVEEDTDKKRVIYHRAIDFTVWHEV